VDIEETLSPRKDEKSTLKIDDLNNDRPQDRKNNNIWKL
jgi:hypothetical protein